MNLAAAGNDGVAFNLLVLLHIVCAVGGFGALIYRGWVLDLARRKGAPAAAGVLSVYGQVSQVAEVLIYGLLIFGVAAIAVNGNHTLFRKPWVVAAFIVYVGMLAILHAIVRPAERRYRRAMLELAQTPAMAPPARPPQLAQMDRLYSRVAIGMGIFNVLLLAALYLMVFKP
jgi:Na+-transporting methylmalonyl-CoA/oxaloacetate decarboxylase gamma subunit